MRSRPPLWRQTPPAIFPVALGFTGLGIAWRGAAAILPLSSAVGDFLMGLAGAFYLYFLVSYLAKLIARPSVLHDDLKTPAGRAGIAALAMVLMLLGLVLDMAGGNGGPVWLAGVGLHIVASLLALGSLLSMPREARLVSPFQLLTFVGLIVAPVAGIRLGYRDLSLWLTLYSLLPFAIISVLYARKLMQARPVPPLRPPLVIFLSPTGLFAIAFAQLGMRLEFDLFYVVSLALAVVFLLRARWLTEGGFGPTWGSFTFPIAVFANMNVTAATTGMVPLSWAQAGVIIGLAIGTPFILYIVYKAGQSFIRGELTRKSGAGIA